jgi:transcription termination factor Rho
MTKAELESKHLAELHALAAEAGVERYRMLGRAELIEKLVEDGGGSESASTGARPSEPSRRRRAREERPRRERRDEKPRAEKPREEKSAGEGHQRGRSEEPRGGKQREERGERGRRQREPRGRDSERPPTPSEPPPAEPAAGEPAAAEPAAASERPRRRRRRRRWGRRHKGLRVHDLLLPAAAGRQSIVYAESRETCTTLLREVAAELSKASNGPDPIALLIDPSPEELADWRRDAPRAEIVAAGRANHADDAIAQATRRAEGGENVIVLIDSLSRFADSYGDADGARALLDSALSASQSATGSLTVVAAIERP